MKRSSGTSALIAVLVLVLVLVLAAMVAGCSRGGDPVDESSIDWGVYNGRAEAFVAAMAAGDFDAAAGMFDATMKRALPAATLESEVWAPIVKRAGEFVSFHKTENKFIDGYYACFVTSAHEASGVTLRVVLSEDGLVSGLFIDAYPIIDRDTVQRDGFTDTPVIVGEGTDFPLDGILSMPDDAGGLVPAVVIVHGSGAQDMDLTLYSNKPYRDIAEHLAANGIAVIRYNKRTFTHGAKFDGSWTVWEETIEDAILAAEMLKADPRVDENRVFVIGHSMGGSLAPRIHEKGGDFAGLILLAGSPRFLLDLSRDQNVAMISETMEGEEKEAALAQIEESWDADVLELVSLSDDVAKLSIIGGASAYYFKDLYNNPVSAYLKRVTVPMLIMQGSKDVQVSAGVDFEMYKELLAGRGNVTYKLYEGLNHLFMASAIGTISGLTDEYQIEGRVDGQVLSDIVEWIKTN